VAKLLFCLSRCDGYAFDVELLMLADRFGYRTVEVPVHWTAVPGSHIRPVRDSVAMAADLLRTRLRWREHQVVEAITASNRRRIEPLGTIERVRSQIPEAEHVVAWKGGALALFPFHDPEAITEMAARLQDSAPELIVDSRPLPAQILLGPNAQNLRTALALVS
jgi:hypothetical protein